MPKRITTQKVIRTAPADLFTHMRLRWLNLVLNKLADPLRMSHQAAEPRKMPATSIAEEM